MGSKLYIIAYKANAERLCGAILYIGYNKEDAEKIYKNNKNVDLHILHRIDSTIQDGVKINY